MILIGDLSGYTVRAMHADYSATEGTVTVGHGQTHASVLDMQMVYDGALLFSTTLSIILAVATVVALLVCSSGCGGLEIEWR